MVNEKSSAVGVNIQEKATVIWNIANALFGYFKPHEYGLVILPMTVVKRFHDCLLPTHDAVIEQYEKVKKLAVIDGFLTRASGYQFYNTSRFTFDSLLADPDNIEANFRDYLAGFSGNVQDVLAKFDFDNIIRRMVECNSLYLVIKEFNSPKGYLGPDKISAVDCGYLCTLQQGISPAQMDEMQSENVILVVPRQYITSYPADRQDRIWTLSKFVSYVREVEGL